jgi:hypothetical protein
MALHGWTYARAATWLTKKYGPPKGGSRVPAWPRVRWLEA